MLNVETGEVLDLISLKREKLSVQLRKQKNDDILNQKRIKSTEPTIGKNKESG